MKGILVDGVGYKPIPKVACTSLKHVLYELKHNEPFLTDLDQGKHIHHYWWKKQEPIQNNSINFIVLRDPIKRFLSAFSNRVSHHEELSKEFLSKKHPELMEIIPKFSPSLSEFIQHFKTYNKVATIEHHFQPVSEIVDNDLSTFSNVFLIEQLGDVATFLSSNFKTKIHIPKTQTGGEKLPVSILTQPQLDYLLDYYYDDYKLLKNYYSVETVLKEWRRGHYINRFFKSRKLLQKYKIT